METFPSQKEPASSSPQSAPCQDDGSEGMAQTEQTIQQGKCGASKHKMTKEVQFTIHKYEWFKLIWFYQLFRYRKLATIKSSIRRSFEH